MPKRADNINAFDLKLLKALLNLMLNKSYLHNLTVEDKRRLCNTYLHGAPLTLSPQYIIKMWPKDNEIRFQVTQSTLDQLCGLLKENYRWYDFMNDVNVLSPDSIPDNVPYKSLNQSQKNLIDESINNIFNRFNSFEEFASTIITKKSEIDHVINANSVIQPYSITSKGIAPELKKLASKVYVELVTRKAAIPIDEKNDLIVEIYDSWYEIFCFIRNELKVLSAECLLEIENQDSVVGICFEILNHILRPHLTEHQAKFRKWYYEELVKKSNYGKTPQQVQQMYAKYTALMDSIKQVNLKMIDYSEQLVTFLDIESNPLLYERSYYNK